MTAALSLIPELDDIVKNGSADRRGEAIERIASLFVQGAAHFEPQHIRLFDEILLGLIPATRVLTRAALSEQICRLSNAPPELIAKLVRENEIGVAGPLLAKSPMIDEATLIEIARMRGQDYLAAIAERSGLSPSVTDVIVRRGDRDTVRVAAGNRTARFSDNGYTGLIRRAADDGVLALKVGQRQDISAPLLKDLMLSSVDIIRRRIFDSAQPKQRLAINRAMAEISGAPKAQLVQRDFAPAQLAILTLHRTGEMGEAALFAFARDHKYEHAVAALSAMCGIDLRAIDDLVIGDRVDPLLLLGRAIGLEWTTVRAMIVLRLGPGKVPSTPDIESARIKYERLSPVTAKRVVNFWRTRDEAKKAPLSAPAEGDSFSLV